MHRLRVLVIVAIAAVALLGGLGTAHATDVALELALVVDISGSVSATEFNTQMDGYGAAFMSASVKSAIESFSGSGGIAVALYFFAQNVVQGVGWTQITTGAQSDAFGTLLQGLARPATSTAAIGGGSLGTVTNVAEGIDRAREAIGANTFQGTRRVIDVSGDGKQNVNRDGSAACTVESATCNGATDAARDAAAAAGIGINGLAIVTTEFPDLATWYTNHVKTGSGSFVLTGTFANFAEAIETKIGREVTGVPEPSTLVLMGVALAGLAATRRRRAD